MSDGLSRHRQPTLHDVARVAGVSHQTVSRVVNQHPNVSATVRERVLEAVRATGYRPNLSARALVMSRTRTIGVLVPATVEQGVTTKVQAIEHAARERGYSVVVTSADVADPDASRAALGRLLAEGVEGVVSVIAHLGYAQLAHADYPLPHVIMCSETVADPDALDRALVERADETGARAVVKHLVGLGHRRIAHVSGPLDWIAATRRLQGYRHAMSEAGLEPLEPLVGDWSAGSGYEQGRLLCARPDITAVFAANDQMAVGVLHAAHDSAVAVPADLSIVGYDDVPESAHAWPPLTSVRKDEAELGRRALLALIAAMDPSAARAPMVPITPHLVIRESSGPVASSRASTDRRRDAPLA